MASCDTEPNVQPQSRSWLPAFWQRHSPTQEEEKTIDYYEQLMFSAVKVPLRQYMVPIHVGEAEYEINTVETMHSDETNKHPLVLLHGFAGGIGVFVKNLDTLAKTYKVYAFDGLGWGKSSRPTFPTDPAEAEALFIDSIEAWRVAMKLDKIILLGHSFGGYLAAAYALKYPQNLRHLVCADPWGFPSRPTIDPRRFPIWRRAIFNILGSFSPLAMLRAFGSYGPKMMSRIRPDFARKFSDVLEDPTTFYHYIYHLNSRPPSAELGFMTLMAAKPVGYAKNPIIDRIANLDTRVPVTFIYGHYTWMDVRMGHRTKELLPNNRVDVHVISGAGHHVYCDDHTTFNDIVIDIADMIEPPDLSTLAPRGSNAASASPVTK